MVIKTQTVYIESFKLLLNKIRQIRKKISYSFIIIIHAFLSKGTSNEETASQDHHLHPCDTDSENTSLFVNNSNISLLFFPDTFMVITCWGFAASFSLLHAFEPGVPHMSGKVKLRAL